MDGGRADAAPAQVLHLVFHKGYERRDDDGHAFGHDGRHLERDALPSPRRHQPEGVMSRRDAAYDVGLDAAETVIPPVGAQRLPPLLFGGQHVVPTGC